MDIRTLGPLEVIDGDAPLPLGAPRQRALLAVLALNAGRTVSISRLIDDLWGEDVPPTAAKMVQIHVSQLRKVLPAEVLVTRPPGYQLDVEPERIDVVRFERLVVQGRAALAAGDPASAGDLLRDALALWRGPALAEFSEPFAGPEAARLEERHLSALEERIAADLAVGRHADVAPELEALVARHPLRERLRAHLMLALYRSDRQAEALAAYQDARRTLSDELGIEPSSGLRDLERRILQQDPALDPPPVAAPAAPGRPAAIVHRRAESPPMVGRERELAVLDEVLAGAISGERRVVIVSGEAGAGKTTLVEAFLEGVVDDGAALVGRGQCVEQHGASEAYMPVLEALERLCREPGGGGVVPLLAERAPTWLIQMPWLVGSAEAAALHERVVGATRERMHREMVEALRELTAGRPVVVLLEDLHWSDLSTLDLLTSLARRREPARLLVLGTYRSADAATRGHPVHAAVAELTARGQCTELALDALRERDVVEYLRARLPGADLPEDLPRTLRERTAGNALFLEKAVDFWVEQEKVRDEGGSWRLDAEPAELAWAMPSSVRQLIRQRLLSVAPEDRRVLEAASAAAPEFSASLVGAACGIGDGEAEERCDALARDGVFLSALGTETWPDGTVAGRFGFSHDLCHEVLYEDLPPGRRARLHVAIGSRLEKAHGERADAIAPELASHFMRGGDPGRAVPHLRAAAAQALERLAPREAIELATRGLEMLEAVEGDGDARRAELDFLTVLGPALVATRGWSSAEAERAFARAGELAAFLDLVDEMAWSAFKLATLYEVRGEYRRSERILEETLADADRPLEGPALADSHELLACSLFHQGAFDRAFESAEQGLAVSDGISVNPFGAAYGDNPAVACHSWAALSLWFLGSPDTARDRAAQAVVLAEDRRQRHGLATALAHASVVSQCRLEPVAAREWAEASIAAAEREGFVYRIAMGTIVRGWSLAMLGDPDEGVAELRRGLEMSRATGARMDDVYYLGLLADALAGAGEEDEALTILEAALDAVPRGGRFFWDADLHRLRGAILRRSGELEKAEASLRRSIAVARDQGGRSLELRAAVELGGLLRSTGRPQEGQALVAAAYGTFTEGFDTPDLMAAAAFLSGPGTAAAPEAPPVRYARSGDISIAYEVTGSGPPDLVLVPGFVSHLEHDRREPRHLRFLERLARHARLIRFDKRGTGLSDRPASLPDLEARMDDLRAVMDAAGSRRAVVFGCSEGGPLSILFAATYPERVDALVLFGCFAKRSDPDDDYPWAPTRAEIESRIARITGERGFEDQMSRLCPSGDEALRRWWGERCRAAASPGAVRALFEMNASIDVRPVLRAIRVPTLVVHRSDDLAVRVEEGRYLADRIPGARFVELAGGDHFVAVDPDQILDVVEPFVREIASLPRKDDDDRVLATVVVAAGARDPVVSLFDGPSRAIRAGLAAVAGEGAAARVGIHTGEIERSKGRPAGPAVSIATEVTGLAAPGEVLVTATTRDLAPGAGLEFQDRGDLRLPSGPTRRLFAASEGVAAGEPSATAEELALD